ncbi:MAG: ATP-binding protein [Cryomorphaceae bacterium]
MSIIKSPHPDALRILLKAVNQTDVGVSVADYNEPDMPLIFVNQAFVEMTGYTREETEGTNCRFLQGNAPNEEARATIRKAIENGESCRVLLQNFRKDGEFFWNELHLSPIYNEKDEITHYAGIQHDVTEREIMAENLKIRKELLVESNRKLRQLTKDKNKLLSTVAHDLRAPLANLTGLHQIIRNVESIEEVDELVDKAALTIDRMRGLVNDYLNYQVIQQGNFELKKTEVDLQKFFIYLTDFWYEEAKSKDIALRMNTSFGCDKVFFDAERMEQVVNNLFSNAIKFSNRGSVIYLTLSSNQNEFLIQVRDEGQGMKKDELEGIFNAFEQRSSKATEGEEGFGLGLSIIKKIVDLHKGKVKVESELGQGTTFTVRIPCKG